jgi:hypothetical protein
MLVMHLNPSVGAETCRKLSDLRAEYAYGCPPNHESESFRPIAMPMTMKAGVRSDLRSLRGQFFSSSTGVAKARCCLRQRTQSSGPWLFHRIPNKVEHSHEHTSIGLFACLRATNRTENYMNEFVRWCWRGLLVPEVCRMRT